MIQEIITYFILGCVAILMVYKIIKFVIKPNENTICKNCSERNSSCSLEKLKKEIAENRIPPPKKGSSI